MTEEDLDTLSHLDATASAAPWHVLFANDDLCMTSVMVTRNPDSGRVVWGHDYQPDSRDVVAACLLQSADVASVSDGRSDENAKLIATVRNALPELLRLAKIGMQAEKA